SGSILTWKRIFTILEAAEEAPKVEEQKRQPSPLLQQPAAEEKASSDAAANGASHGEEAVDYLGQLLTEAAFGKSCSWDKLPQIGPNLSASRVPVALPHVAGGLSLAVACSYRRPGAIGLAAAGALATPFLTLADWGEETRRRRH
uniref:Uncharacterized protein n=1 Tax=Oryza barthii TaxID=65489 RepID=A0A0D3FYI9_9ORYZ